MSIERKTQTLNASGRAELGRGNFFLLLTASAVVNVRADRDGTSEGFNGVSGGVLIRRVRPWDQMIIEGAAGDTIEYYVGSEIVDRDETDIRLAVTAIAGTVPVSESARDTITDSPAVTASNPSSPAADETVLVAANPNRKRLRISAKSDNPGSCFVLAASGGNFIAEMQPGVAQQFDVLQGLWISNDTGGDCVFYIDEEV